MRFEVLMGPEDGRIVEFQEKEVRIGRRPDKNDFVLSWDQWVSKEHATVTREGEIFKVVDRESTNGTSIRKGINEKCDLGKRFGEREEAQLTPGDILIMGRLWIRFLG